MELFYHLPKQHPIFLFHNLTFNLHKDNLKKLLIQNLKFKDTF